MAKIMLEAYQCHKCGYIWRKNRSTLDDPKQCPKCKYVFWRDDNYNENNKVCSECGATKTYSNWRKDGKGGWLCKKCYMRNYFRRPKRNAIMRKVVREYNRNHKEEKAAYNWANRERFNALRREYRRKNPDKVKKWKQNHIRKMGMKKFKEYISEKNRRYRLKKKRENETIASLKGST